MYAWPFTLDEFQLSQRASPMCRGGYLLPILRMNSGCIAEEAGAETSNDTWLAILNVLLYVMEHDNQGSRALVQT